MYSLFSLTSTISYRMDLHHRGTVMKMGSREVTGSSKLSYLYISIPQLLPHTSYS